MPPRSPAPGPVSRELAERAGAVECPAFGHRRTSRPGADALDSAPIVLASGEGCGVIDVDGNRYVDFAAGFGSVLLGHGHPSVVAAVRAQAERLLQGLGDVYASDVKVALMEDLASLHPSGRGQVLLTQSGSDAVAAALKTATLATGRHGFLAFEGAYHGLGHGPLAACGFRESFRAPFAPQLNRQVRFCPYPGIRGTSLDAALSAVRRALEEEPVAAVLVEPVLGRGGCIVPPDPFLVELAALARAAGALLIADEVWTGLGRTGSWLRSADLGVEADILCLGKGLGGGLPISACVASREAMAGWAHGETIHTSTHAGAPLGCAAALAVLRELREGPWLRQARARGGFALERLRQRLAGSPVRDVRGVGLMIGVELESASAALRATRELLRRGFLSVTGGLEGDTLTLTPPLAIDEQHLLAFGDALAECLASP